MSVSTPLALAAAVKAVRPVPVAADRADRAAVFLSPSLRYPTFLPPKPSSWAQAGRRVLPTLALAAPGACRGSALFARRAADRAALHQTLLAPHAIPAGSVHSPEATTSFAVGKISQIRTQRPRLAAGAGRRALSPLPKTGVPPGASLAMAQPVLLALMTLLRRPLVVRVLAQREAPADRAAVAVATRRLARVRLAVLAVEAQGAAAAARPVPAQAALVAWAVVVKSSQRSGANALRMD